MQFPYTYVWNDYCLAQLKLQLQLDNELSLSFLSNIPTNQPPVRVKLTSSMTHLELILT